MATSELSGRHQIRWVMLAMDSFRGSSNTYDLMSNQVVRSVVITVPMHGRIPRRKHFCL